MRQPLDAKRSPAGNRRPLTKSLPGDTSTVTPPVATATTSLTVGVRVRCENIPNYGKSPNFVASDLGLCEPMCALLAAALPQCPDNIAHISEQGFQVAKTWPEYETLLAAFDAGLTNIEPEGPHATSGEEPLVPKVEAGSSERTERRHRSIRRSEVNAIIARDGRATADSAVKRVKSRRTAGDDRWLKMCDQCAHTFEAKRDDARFCSNRCRVAARRRATS